MAHVNSVLKCRRWLQNSTHISRPVLSVLQAWQGGQTWTGAKLITQKWSGSMFVALWHWQMNVRKEVVWILLYTYRARLRHCEESWHQPKSARKESLVLILNFVWMQEYTWRSMRRDVYMNMTTSTRLAVWDSERNASQTISVCALKNMAICIILRMQYQMQEQETRHYLKPFFFNGIQDRSTARPKWWWRNCSSLFRAYLYFGVLCSYACSLISRNSATRFSFFKKPGCGKGLADA
jgi:hypothetical protein